MNSPYVPKVYPEGQTWLYVVVRTDIPLAQQIVQVGHACAESGAVFSEAYSKRGHFSNMVLLQVGGELEMMRAYQHVRNRGLKAVRFYEPDYGINGVTAFCVEPITIESRSVFVGYKLWKEPLSSWDKFKNWFIQY